MSDTQNAIHWPDRYLPGTTDNFVSNEVIVKGLSHQDVWPLLADTSKWTSYYDNASAPVFPSGGGPLLTQGAVFSFATFGFPPLDAEVVEYVEPGDGTPGRLSWTAQQDGTPEEKLDVLHAWLVEDLPGGRVRILTQESQIGRPAADLAVQKPNPMLNGHQTWLDGLVAAAGAGT
ncbi:MULTISPECIES: SRPBCC domain-containing protein [unclassified Streptomyces]|uniref:SRPBCC domain-containing protein n=1 Tax=unclassified Streptomyces TaxID=2593676 RepID=UPI0036EA7CD3